MKRMILCGLAAAMSFASAKAQTSEPSWEGIHKVDMATMEQSFQTTPNTYASHLIWGLEGNMDKKLIKSDLDAIKAVGFRNVILEAGYRLPYEYLSDGWFKMIKTIVQEAKKRDMKVWIIDEGKYPSGFAGGKFTRERPDLRMQAIVLFDQLEVKAGQRFEDAPAPEGALSAVAVSKSGNYPNRVVEIEDGKFSFVAAFEDWTIHFAKQDFRTGQTRAVNNPTGGKDTSNSICDYLDPAAVRQFIDWTHEQYKKWMGNEFGKTILGFRGDEPDYSHTPWTENIVEKFIEVKGYDPTPYFASIVAPAQSLMSTEQQRVKADYWDVWSAMFADSFFKQQADWCEENGLAHITHLNNEHNMPVCVRAEGDAFRDLSKVQIPGVDAIWNQIWPGTQNDFPKLASSVAHVYGKPRSFSESFAAYNIPPTIPQAKFVIDHQIARGINFFEIMFWAAGSNGQKWMREPGMKELNDYMNRATYLMAQGTPGSRIAMYYPTSSLWNGANDTYQDLVTLTALLLSHQRDFDYVNDDAFTEALTVGNGCLVNKSGQRYETLIIPSADFISEDAWKQIELFSSKGGKVIFWGRTPSKLVGRSFTDPKPCPEIKGAEVEHKLEWTRSVDRVMPEPELRLVSAPSDSIRYSRRIVEDGELYFIFNEGNVEGEYVIELDQVGETRLWNAEDGTVQPLKSERKGDKTIVTLQLGAWDSKIVAVSRRRESYDVTQHGVKADGSVQTRSIQKLIDQVASNGGGTIVFPAGEYMSGALFFPRGVNLTIEEGATLTGTVVPEDYPVIATRFEGIERDWRCAFLNFDNSDGVVVKGKGTVKGNGIEWSKVSFGNSGRPRLICFTNCPGGSISDLHLVDQASWCLHVLYTDGFDIKDVDIRAIEYIPSSDGIDLDSSTNIHVSGAYIYVHDDCISIKSGRDTDGRRVARPCENILIEDCNLAYGHAGVAMGSEISGDVRNVTIRRCIIDNDNWAPLRFKSQPSRGGVVENILFEDIKINSARTVFEVNMTWRMKPPLYPDAPQKTILRNITFRNIEAEAASAGMFHGYEDAPLAKDAFKFDNVNIKVKKGLSLQNCNVDFKDLNMTIVE